MKTVGERVKKLRTDAGLTQKALSEILSIAESTLGCYELNRRQIPYSVLIAIAKYFDVSTDFLLGLADY